MLMPGMLRRLPLFVLALALWFAAEPLVHSHPLLTSSGASPSVCAVCATGVDRPLAAPAVVAPLHIIDVVDDAPPASVEAVAAILLASRAPPAA
jgi:hypothetical protein